jgi:hypothetical protein
LYIPPIDDAYHVLPRENFTDLEWNSYGHKQYNTYAMIAGLDTWETNPYLFTSNMPLETMQNVPPTVIYTTEYDFCRQ